MTPLRDRAIADAVDALLAAGMLTDPEECARTYSLISELIATGKDDDAERAYRLAAKAWRRARDVADGKPLAQRDDEARIERAARAIYANTRAHSIARLREWDDAPNQEDTDAG